MRIYLEPFETLERRSDQQIFKQQSRPQERPDSYLGGAWFLFCLVMERTKQRTTRTRHNTGKEEGQERNKSERNGCKNKNGRS